MTVVLQQCADGDCGGGTGLRRRGGGRPCGWGRCRSVLDHAQLVCESFDLCLELHDAIVVRTVQRLNEFAHLFHLQPQVGPEHDEIVKSRAHHAAVCGKHGVAMGFVELAENPGKVSCRIVDLHILPVGHRGDGGTGEQEVAVGESAVNRAGGERPQSLGVHDARPAVGDFLGNMAGGA